MKDYDKQFLESQRPQVSAYQTITFCLEQLYNDDCHQLSDDVVAHLTFEELIGALLLGLDAAVELEKCHDRNSDDEQ